MNIEIERGIPAPQVRSKTRKELPFSQLQVGESFFVPDTELKPITVRCYAISDQRVSTRRFTCRKVKGGMRVWRIA